MSQFLEQYGLQILARSLEHLWLSLLAISGAMVIGVPLGIWLAHHIEYQKLILKFIKAINNIPSIATFGFLLPILGLGNINAVLAISIYSITSIIRDTFAGLNDVDPNVREAARALGMTPQQMLRRVELPLAADSIVAGIRRATISCIGLVAIASFFGAGGLGNLIGDGLRTGNNALILAGAIAVTSLALGADWALSLWQKSLSVWRAKTPKSAR